MNPPARPQPMVANNGINAGILVEGKSARKSRPLALHSSGGGRAFGGTKK